MSLPTEPGSNSKNSVFANTDHKSIAQMPILPIRDTAAKKTEPAFDIVDEALYHFRTNIFMRDFQIKSDADRMLIYLTFYGMKCLKFFAKNPKDKAKCQKEIQSWNMNPFPIPGEGGFILSALVTKPENGAEGTELRAFLKAARVEMGTRLLEIVFKDGTADKWWICFAPRKFMDKEMAN